jgi:hypothetical protein
LLSIANDVGAAARISGLGGWSKTELVQVLVRHFASAIAPDAPDDECTRKARTWLPGILRFPATETLSEEV